MIRYKSGVLTSARRNGVTCAVHDAIWKAIDSVEFIWRKWGADPWVTSLLDGRHRRGSLHYVGMAADFRSRDLPEAHKEEIVSELASDLGADYDVILESRGRPNEHIHVEYQPKEPWG